MPAQTGLLLLIQIFHPIAERLLEHCDAVIRVGGPSQGADLMVKVAQQRGLSGFHQLREVPGASRCRNRPMSAHDRPDPSSLPIFTIVPVSTSASLTKYPGVTELFRRLRYPIPGFPD